MILVVNFWNEGQFIQKNIKMKQKQIRLSNHSTWVLLAIIFFFSFPVLGQDKKTPPNVIFIICDQMRGDAMGVAGNTNARTPNLDRLAREGVFMRNNYSNNPVCLPSRISMFSGLYPHQTGIMCNKSEGDWLSFEGSLPWHFKQAGYRTAYVGKNHTYKDDEFEHFDFASIRAREVFRAYSKYVPPFWHSDVLWPEEDCNPRKNTDEAISFIRQNTDQQPFFMHVSYFDPHPPYMAPAEFTQHYSSQSIVLPEYIDPSMLGQRLADQQKALHYDKISDADLKKPCVITMPRWNGVWITRSDV
jgi:arylsulfatase A-like enzyme